MQALYEFQFNNLFKGKDVLLHGTSFANCQKILESNELKAKGHQTTRFQQLSKTVKTEKISPKDEYSIFNGISFTRNWDYIYAFGFKTQCQLIFDRVKIRRDYGKKLKPFDYAFQPFYQIIPYKTKDNPDREARYESEEFLMSNLKPVSKYLLGIKLFKGYEKEMLGWLDTNFPNIKVVIETAPKMSLY